MKLILKGYLFTFFFSFPADVQNMEENTGTLSLILNGKGGIVDDVIVTKTDLDYLYVVSNAGCAMKVKSHVEVSIKFVALEWI